MADFRNIFLNFLKITDPEWPQNFFCDETSGINQSPPKQMCRMVLCRSLLVPNELCVLGFFSRLSNRTFIASLLQHKVIYALPKDTGSIQVIQISVSLLQLTSILDMIPVDYVIIRVRCRLSQR